MFQCPHNNCNAVLDENIIKANLSLVKRGLCPRCAQETGLDLDLSKYESAPVTVPEVIEEILEEIPESEIVTEEVDWESYTITQLKEALKERGLSIKGKKATLLKRLEE